MFKSIIFKPTFLKLALVPVLTCIFLTACGGDNTPSPLPSATPTIVVRDFQLTLTAIRGTNYSTSKTIELKTLINSRKVSKTN